MKIDSRWSCRKECRDPANGFDDLQTCYAACDCRQDCPTSIDYLTTECKAACAPFELGTLESDLCIEKCYSECGERCRSTMNGYIVPLDLYAQGLDILDCYFGDLKGDATASCAGGQQFWQSEGYICTVTEGNSFDCECEVPGTCLSLVYPCDYEYYCVSSRSPSESPSESPSAYPSSAPSEPSVSPLAPPVSPNDSSPSPPPATNPVPTGKGKGDKRDDGDSRRRRVRRASQTRDS